jgi:hypothetical protein
MPPAKGKWKTRKKSAIINQNEYVIMLLENQLKLLVFRFCYTFLCLLHKSIKEHYNFFLLHTTIIFSAHKTYVKSSLRNGKIAAVPDIWMVVLLMETVGQ